MVLWQYYITVPPKVRDLMRKLEAAGFQNRGGKGSHRNYQHPGGVNITISGTPGKDAKKYQMRDVQHALWLVTDEKK